MSVPIRLSDGTVAWVRLAKGVKADDLTAEDVEVITAFAQELRERAKEKEEPKTQKQTKGPRCKKCGAFTTYTRVNSHGMCMKCENAARKP